MAEQTWEYKGHKITLMPSAKFSATVDGKYYQGSSLSAAKKSIDKHLVEKAEEVEVNLPVVTLAFKHYHGTESQAIITHSVIAGIDRETLIVQGIKQERFEGRLEYVLPDSEANEKLLTDLVEAKKVVATLEKKLNSRNVGVHYGSYSRSNRVTYADAMKKLQENYAAAKKGKSDE